MQQPRLRRNLRNRISLFTHCFWQQDPELLSFIDIECYCWSTVLAEFTPMINAGMVFCDRHYGGINYPKARCSLLTILLLKPVVSRCS